MSGPSSDTPALAGALPSRAAVTLAPEPHAGRFASAWSRGFFATRPAFLSVTLGGWMLGMVSLLQAGLPLDGVRAALTLIFALVAHAGVNVINDYYDAIDGTDALNEGRVFPFTGGSRFIQNGVLSAGQTARLGYGLLAMVIPGGLWLALGAPGLVWIGLAGLFTGWAYSARPLSLMRRGWGEACVTAGFLLIVAGTDCVQRGVLSWQPVVLGLPFALLVTAILFLNQFPDHAGDAAAGKRNWVVRLGPQRARWLYPALALGAHGGWLALCVTGILPPVHLLALLAAPVSLFATAGVLRHAAQPACLPAAIRATIAAAMLHAVLAMAASLIHVWGWA